MRGGNEVGLVHLATAVWIILILAVLFYLLFVFPTQWLKVEHIDWTILQSSHWETRLEDDSEAVKGEAFNEGVAKSAVANGGLANTGTANALTHKSGSTTGPKMDERIRRTKILQISDIHIERNRALPGLVKVLTSERPDYIFLTGDFLDSPTQFPKLKRFLSEIHSFHIPTYAVFGNHDYLLQDINQLADLLASEGVRVLRNECIILPNFALIGIDDYTSGAANAIAAFSTTPHGLRRFVITHDATLLLDMDETFDALISGHFHGKQFNLPFLFRLQPMGPLPAHGIYKGLHNSSKGPFYISKGMGQSGFNLRLFVRSEVTMHLI